MVTNTAKPTANPKKSPAPPRDSVPDTDRTNFIFYANPTLTLMCVPGGASVGYSLEAASELTRVHPDLIRYYCRLGLLDLHCAENESELTFDENALGEIRRLEHFRRHLGVCRRALPLILALWHESQSQQIELQFLCEP